MRFKSDIDGMMVSGINIQFFLDCFVNKKRIMFLMSFILFLQSCFQENYENTMHDKVEINIVDSLIFYPDRDFVNILDFNESYLFGINTQKDKVFVYEKTGEIKKIIDQKGEGPNEYNKLAKVGITSHDEILIADSDKILFFDINSDRVSRCVFDKENILPIPPDLHISGGDNGMFYFTSSSMKYSPRNEVYFDSIHTFTSFSRDCSFDNLGGYPTKSVYQENTIVTAFEPKMHVDPSGERIYQLFPYGKYIFVYDLSGTLVKSIPTSPDYFGSTVTNKEHSLESIIYLLQKNSRYRNIVVGKEYIILHYLQALPDEEIVKSLARYNKEGRFKRKQFFSIYNLNGEKLGVDFEDKNISYLIGFDEQGYLWFQSITDDIQVKIYKAKISL